MSDAAWMIMSQSITAVVLGVIGYVSLRYKASADHVAELEATIVRLSASVKLLEVDYEKCQAERRKLREDNAKQSDEITSLKTEKLTREIVRESVAEQKALIPVAPTARAVGTQAIPVVIVPDPNAPPTPVKETK